METAFAWAMAGAASAHQAATATRVDTSPQRAGRTRRTSAVPQRAQQGATGDAAAAPAALDSLSRLQQLADASPQVAQLRRLQALADGQFAPVAQLAGGPEEEELVQGKFATAQLQPQLQQAPRANNTGLPDQLKSGIESLSGMSMDDVRVHYNSAQPAQLNALAYAQGNDIHLGPGQEQHLPHEAWHVVQQAQGRVRPTLQLKDGVPVNDDVGLEREADVMGARALSEKPVHPREPRRAEDSDITISRRSRAPLTGHASLQRMAHGAPSLHHLRELNETIQTRVAHRFAHTARFATPSAVAQLNGTAMAELGEHLKQIPTYMHEAIWRWVGLLGASAVLAYLTGGGSLLAQATIFLFPTVGWLASGVIKRVKDRVSGDGLKIGTGPLIEDTFHLATYNFPWLPGTYSVIRNSKDLVASGDYIFILDVSENFYYCDAADRKVEGAHLYVRHSQLAGGAKVKTAGRMSVMDGVCKLTNESGHYWPQFDTLTAATKFLEERKVFSNVTTTEFNPKNKQE
jgi:hypothetical protein